MNKNEKDGLRVLVGLIFILGVVMCIIINTIRANLVRYEYYKDGKFGISKECYVTERDECMCKIDNNFVQVEAYYKVEK